LEVKRGFAREAAAHFMKPASGSSKKKRASPEKHGLPLFRWWGASASYSNGALLPSFFIIIGQKLEV
jgi:hypothetical protein